MISARAWRSRCVGVSITSTGAQRCASGRAMRGSGLDRPAVFRPPADRGNRYVPLAAPHLGQSALANPAPPVGSSSCFLGVPSGLLRSQLMEPLKPTAVATISLSLLMLRSMPVPTLRKASGSPPHPGAPSAEGRPVLQCKDACFTKIISVQKFS